MSKFYLRAGTGGWLVSHGGKRAIVSSGVELLGLIRERLVEVEAANDAPPAGDCILVLAERLTNGVLVQVEDLELLAVDGRDEVAAPLWQAIVSRPETLVAQLRGAIHTGDDDERLEISIGPFRFGAPKGQLRTLEREGSLALRLAQLLSTPGDK